MAFFFKDGEGEPPKLANLVLRCSLTHHGIDSRKADLSAVLMHGPSRSDVERAGRRLLQYPLVGIFSTNRNPRRNWDNGVTV